MEVAADFVSASELARERVLVLVLAPVLAR